MNEFLGFVASRQNPQITPFGSNLFGYFDGDVFLQAALA